MLAESKAWSKEFPRDLYKVSRDEAPTWARVGSSLSKYSFVEKSAEIRLNRDLTQRRLPWMLCVEDLRCCEQRSESFEATTPELLSDMRLVRQEPRISFMPFARG